MEFKNAITGEDKGAKVAPKDTTRHILIGDVVCVYNGEDHEVDFESIKTFEDVLKLDESKPNVLLHTKPALYSAFKSKSGKSIETYVKIGDMAVYKIPEASPIKGNPALKVIGLELKSLGSMAVVIAHFEGGDYAVANHIKKV